LTVKGCGVNISLFFWERKTLHKGGRHHLARIIIGKELSFNIVLPVQKDYSTDLS
jgi:hypothetical protein